MTDVEGEVKKIRQEWDAYRIDQRALDSADATYRETVRTALNGVKADVRDLKHATLGNADLQIEGAIPQQRRELGGRMDKLDTGVNRVLWAVGMLVVSFIVTKILSWISPATFP